MMNDKNLDSQKNKLKEIKRAPELRFKGFSDDWEQRKLGDLSTSFEYGLNASAKGFDGINKYIRITDIDDSSRKFNHESLTSPDIDLSSADNYKLKDGDILFARTGASVGKTYIYTDSDGLVYYAGFLIRARIKSGVDSNFVFQHTLTSSYENFIRVISQRSGQPGVNAKEYSIFEIGVPSYEEQHKIGTFFKQLDSTITLHQRKLEKLKLLKHGYLQQLFPQNSEKIPRVRFAKFENKWEQCEFSELAEIRRGLTYKPSDVQDVGVRVLRSSNISEDTFLLKSDDVFVKSEAVNIEEVRNGDILITSANGSNRLVGKHAIIDGIREKTAHGGFMLVARAENPQFTNALMSSNWYSKFINVFVSGGNGSIGNLSKTVLESQKIFVPNKDEQDKIALFFSNLDSLITLHQEKLKQLKTCKKALLQKMFI